MECSSPYALSPKPVDFDSKWNSLRSSIQSVITLQNLDRKTWDNNFSDIYSICVAVPEPLSELLYRKTSECIQEHVQQLYKEVELCDSGTLLSAYYSRWVVYSKGTNYIHNLYGYLNKQYIKAMRYTDVDLACSNVMMPNEPFSSPVLEVGELLLDIWYRYMILPLSRRLITRLLTALADDRDNRSYESETIVKGVILSLVEVKAYKKRDQMDLYKSLFEEKMLIETSDHYKYLSEEMLSKYSCSEYMKKVLHFLSEEETRARRFLHLSSSEKVIEICEKVMIADHLEKLNAYTEETVSNENLGDMLNMYKLLKPIKHGLTKLIKAFEYHIKQMGMNKIQLLPLENPAQYFVEEVLTVYSKFNEIVSSTFSDDQEFVTALDRAMSSIVNYKEAAKICPKASEWLAKYIDLLLKKSAKNVVEEIEEKLTLSIVIFRYIEDKDIFHKFYSRMLANRLIHGLSFSMEYEELMINKLRKTCGYEFTSKLQRMFSDMSTSQEMMGKFEGYIREHNLDDQLPVHLQVQVLQAGAWPLNSTSPSVDQWAVVPTQLQPLIQLFQQFYGQLHQGRKLNWLFNYATAEVKTNYLEKHYQITMSLHQLALVSYFESNDEISETELKENFGMAGSVAQDENLFSKTLRSLVDYGILESKDDQLVSLNMKFSSKRLKFKIFSPSVQKTQSDRESDQVTATIKQDRKHFVECAIVRIMKARKVLRHHALVEEVLKQTSQRFTPDILFIKRTIESLIDKQYIARTEKNDEYHYLA